MNIRTRKRWLGALLSALTTIALAVPASADGVLDIAGALPGATSAGLQTELTYQTAVAANVSGAANNVTCRVELLANQGVAQTDPGPAVVKGHDVGSADIPCVSLDETKSYTIVTDAWFEYYDGWLGWQKINETVRTCSQPSVFGQGNSACAIQYTYPVGHYSVNKLHQACFDLQTPTDLPKRCSPAFLTVDGTFTATTTN